MATKKVKTTSRINKQKEIEQKRRKKRKSILITFLILIAIIGIYVYLLQAETFKIKNIEIIGNNQLTQEKIYELSKLKLGDSIFAVPSIVEKVKLKQNGYLEDVKVRKKYPNTLELEVKERQRKFQIQTEAGNYIYIDEQGYLLECAQEKLELITIVGMDITENNLDTKHRLEDDDLDRMENVLQIQENAKEIGILDKITQIQVKDEYMMNLENDGININLGNATNLKNRMFYVKAILEQEAGNRGTIYVNGNLNEGFTPYFSAN